MDRMLCVPRILSAKNRRLGTPLSDDELLDLVQDVLALIWRKRAEFEGRSALETWVYRIALFELMNGIRRKQRHSPRESVRVEAVSLEDPSAAAETADFRFVYEGLERLGPPDEDVIRLKHFDELTFQQIGERLDVSPNTAKTWYYRGMKKLRAMLRLPFEEGAP